MGSKSTSGTTDGTSNAATNNVQDRRAIQQQGQQILDSVVVDPSDKVMIAAIQELKAGFLDASERNTATVKTFLSMSTRLMELADKGQVQISQFGYQALRNSRDQLEAMERQGALTIKLADKTVSGAMSLAERVTGYQKDANREALEILADTKTGDYSDNLKSLSGMVMLFALAALYIARKGA